jgi:hypothetical protein
LAYGAALLKVVCGIVAGFHEELFRVVKYERSVESEL